MKRKVKIDRIILLAGCCFLILFTGFQIFSKDKEEIIKEKDVHIACIGDSLTYGNGVMEHRKEEAWPFVLDAMLPETYHVYNYGISGATVQTSADNPYVYHKEWDEILNNPADVYILMLGSNDTRGFNWNAENFRKEYAWMADEILGFSWNPQLVVMLPTKIFYPEMDFILENEVIPIILDIAEERNLEVIDLHTLTENDRTDFPDGLHPGTEGNEKIAKYIYKKLYD